MNRPETIKYSVGRVIAGCAISLGVAISAPLAAGMSTTIIVFTVVTAIMYAFAGMIPAVASMLMNVAAFGLYFGTPGALVAAVGFALPSAVVVRNLRLRVPLFNSMVQAIVAQIAGVVGALAIAYAYVGADVIGALMNELRTFTEMLTPGTVDFILDKLYAIDSVPDMLTEEQLMNGVLDAARRAEYIDSYLNDMSAALRLTLPGLLLSASCLTGIVATALPAKIMYRKHPHPGAYVPMARWFTPWSVSLGLLGLWVITWLLSFTDMSGIDVAQLAMQALLFLVLRVQATVSLERRLMQMNTRPGIRVLIIIIIQLVFAELAIYYGAFSALFGMTGAAAQIRVLRGKDGNEQ